MHCYGCADLTCRRTLLRQPVQVRPAKSKGLYQTDSEADQCSAVHPEHVACENSLFGAFSMTLVGRRKLLRLLASCRSQRHLQTGTAALMVATSSADQLLLHPLWRPSKICGLIFFTMITRRPICMPHAACQVLRSCWLLLLWELLLEGLCSGNCQALRASPTLVTFSGSDDHNKGAARPRSIRACKHRCTPLTIQVTCMDTVCAKQYDDEACWLHLLTYVTHTAQQQQQCTWLNSPGSPKTMSASKKALAAQHLNLAAVGLKKAARRIAISYYSVGSTSKQLHMHAGATLHSGKPHRPDRSNGQNPQNKQTSKRPNPGVSRQLLQVITAPTGHVLMLWDLLAPSCTDTKRKGCLATCLHNARDPIWLAGRITAAPYQQR